MRLLLALLVPVGGLLVAIACFLHSGPRSTSKILAGIGAVLFAIATILVLVGAVDVDDD